MAASCQDLILSILQELEKESFKRFKAYLRDKEFLGLNGFSPIPRVQLEDKDCVDVADRLINHYTGDNALRVMKIVLEKINEKTLAQRIPNNDTFTFRAENMDLK
ncbi:NACHT, LRR and PYD domains-containing protein 6-like [Phyllobates terribilis]|uniref:NACHT, LRR and PYD domains-containing protein 6-like n=1 Tax=Phyllobates terribilis TaxID=111132 RepID=UPI003CCAECC6